VLPDEAGSGATPARAANAARSADGRGVASRGGGAGGAPAGDGGDSPGGEGSAGVDAEVDGAQQRGERVDRAGALAGNLIAGSGQDPQDRAIPGVAGTARPLSGQPASGAGDRGGVDGVALPAGAAYLVRDVGSLGDVESGGGELVGEDRAVGAGAVAEDQGGAGVGAAFDPGLRAA
jgi:hypothetical protein